jgi:multiple sugar transport system ATP-binding protein
LTKSTPPAAVAVALRGVSRHFVGSPRAALADVTIEVPAGEFCVVIGPSGCGKSTTLRMVAGLDQPDRGEVELGGRSMAGVAPQDRDVAMVFQGYALYPHMTARETMEFPLKMRKVPAAERRRQVDEAAEMLRLGPLLDRRPDQLSGGERQRVAMGRALVRRPRVFLFDEPLSNLDASLRAGIRAEIGTLVRKTGATALYVTHDHVEAMTLADRIVLMRDGTVQQQGSPRTIYERPASAFVATFVGSPRMNLLRMACTDGALRLGPLTVPLGLFSGLSSPCPATIELGIRCEALSLRAVDENGGETPPAASPSVVGTVTLVEPLGAETHVTVAIEGGSLVARVAGFAGPKVGERTRVLFDPAALHLFDPARAGAAIAIATRAASLA